MLTKKDLPLIVGYLPYKLRIKILLRFPTDNGGTYERTVIEEWRLDDVQKIYTKTKGVVDILPVLKPIETLDIKEYYKMSRDLDFDKEILKIPNLLKNAVLFECEEYAMDFLAQVYLEQYLYTNHYDIHGLIEQGKAVDWREIDE